MTKTKLASVHTSGQMRVVRHLLLGWATFSMLLSGNAMAQSAVGLSYGVLVDRTAQVAYLISPENQLEAIDLGSGQPRWATTEAQVPLAVVDDAVVAQAASSKANQLRIVVLDKSNGGARSTSDIDLPEEVDTSIDDARERTFGVRVSVEGGEAVLAWRFSSSPKGKPKNRRTNVTAGVRASGTERLDPRSGRVTRGGPGEPKAKRAALPQRVEAELPAGGPRWQTSNIVASVERRDEGGQKKVFLRRWSLPNGREQPPVALFGAAELALRHPSADERHLLASRRAPGSDLAWIWQIYSIESGALVATLQLPDLDGPFVLSGNSLIYFSDGAPVNGVWVNAPQIRVVDLRSGVELWSRPVRDTRYRGPQVSRSSDAAGAVPSRQP